MCEMEHDDTVTMRRLIVNETPEPKNPSFHFQWLLSISFSELILGLYFDRIVPNNIAIEMSVTAFFFTVVVFSFIFMVRKMIYREKLNAFKQNVKKSQFRIIEETDFLKEIINLAQIEEDDLEFSLQPHTYAISGIDKGSLFCKAELFYCGHSIASLKNFYCHYQPSYVSVVGFEKDMCNVFLREIYSNIDQILRIKQKKII